MENTIQLTRMHSQIQLYRMYQGWNLEIHSLFQDTVVLILYVYWTYHRIIMTWKPDLSWTTILPYVWKRISIIWFWIGPANLCDPMPVLHRRQLFLSIILSNMFSLCIVLMWPSSITIYQRMESLYIVSQNDDYRPSNVVLTKLCAVWMKLHQVYKNISRI